MAPGNRPFAGGAQLSLTGDLEAMRSRIAELEADNAHLRGMLKISEQQSKRPGAAPTVMFDAAPGTVTSASTAKDKVAFYASLFRARSDVYAVRWDSDRTGRGGWMPAVQGGFRKAMRPADRHYLPLTEDVITRHLSGDLEIGLYPLLDNDRCHWLAADFDGDTAVLDALAYLKAARSYGATAALEVSRSGAGAHVWVFFTSAVPAAQARQLGTGLLREAMTMAGRLNLASYDRLFHSKDLLPAGVIVLHDLNLAAAHADRVALVERGRVSAVGPPRDVLVEDVLGRAYEHPVDVVQHPRSGAIVVLPRR